MPERTPKPTHAPRSDGRIRPSANKESSAPIPKTGQPSTPATRVKSFVRKILLASPAFPRLYADVVIASAPNSNEAKILAPNYKKIIGRVNARMNSARMNNERTNQLMSNPKSCTHIKVTGVRCGSPALRGEQFCYFHQRMLRTVRVPDSRIRHAALLEDEASIQVSLMEVVNSLLRGTIELKRAELILRALNTAVRNIRRVHFDLHQEDMVKEIPAYAPAPITEVDEQAAAEADRVATRAEIARATAAHLSQAHLPTDYLAEANKLSSNGRTPVAPDAFVRPPSVANVGTNHVETAHVGTAAPGCPGGPGVLGRSAVTAKPSSTEPARIIARKPPLSAKAQAPKERKNAAHGASRG